MKHARWLHVICLVVPLVVLVLILSGADRGVILIVWVLCPLVMFWMLRHRVTSTQRSEHPGARAAPPPRRSPVPAGRPDTTR